MKFLFVIAVLVLSSCCTTKPYVAEEAKFPVKKGETVFIVSHGWHTGIVIPARPVQEAMPEIKDRFGETTYLEFGWGDKGFYQANEITSGITLQAIFWPTESVVHVVALSAGPQDYFKNSVVKSVELRKDEFALLVTYLSNSFLREEGKLVSMKKGIYGDSQFYKGEGSYHLMNTCNKWTAKGLKSAKLDLDPSFMLTAGSVMGSVDDLEDVLLNAAN